MPKTWRTRAREFAQAMSTPQMLAEADLLDGDVVKDAMAMGYYEGASDMLKHVNSVLGVERGQLQ